VRFNNELIAYHIKNLHDLAARSKAAGKLVLASFGQDPDTGENLPPIARHFAIGDVDGMVAAALEFESVPHRNGYAPFAVMRPDLPEGQKGTEDDVLATLALVVDADSDHGKDTPQSPLPANYEIESSPGNFQQVLILDRPLSPGEAKPMAAALKRATGDKSASDLSHVWRIPGGLNWPNRKKVQRGRSREPQPVTIKSYWQSWTAVDGLRAVLEPHWREPTGTITAPVPPALDGYRLEEVAWWIDRKIAAGDWELSQQDWAMFGGALKLHFGSAGLELFQRMSHDPDQAAKRFEKFEAKYAEGDRTLFWYLERDRDTTWMFRSAFGCPQPPVCPVPLPIPAEIIERHKREREQYQAAVLGPLPDHPELPIDQAHALNDYWAHLPSGKMIYERTGELFNSASVDKHIGRVKDPMKTEGPGTLASTWLSQHRFVKSMGWAPGEPKIIENKVLTNDGWIRSHGDRTFNLYVPPHVDRIEGDVSKWLSHIKAIYPGEADHIVMWLAHRVQRPGEKVNHALVFIGSQGIGKDTILKPAITAIGPQNFKQITAKTFFNSEWNDYLQSVILRINEVHDLGGESRYGFYDATKDVITNPPEAHRINTKHVPQYAAANVCGVVMTSNHLDALYLAPDDRRHFVCVSTRTQEDFAPGYWDEINAWFENGGNEAVAYYLANLDLNAFNAKAPPPKTTAWHMVVAAGVAPESGDLADVIEDLGKPDALTLQMVKARTPGDSQLRLLFEDAKFRRAIPKRLAECGYVAISNPDAGESGGRWRVAGGKTTIYARQELTEDGRLAAARLLSASAGVPQPIPSRP